MNKTYIYIGAGILAVILLVVIIRKITKTAGVIQKKGETPPVQNRALVNTSSWSCSQGDTFPLRFGSCGENVKIWQKHLGVSADGKFGPKTESSTLSKIGVKEVGEATFNLMLKEGKTPKTNAESTPVYTMEDMAVEIRTDDKAWRVIPRSESEPLWAQVDKLPTADLGKLYDLYKQKYNESLYAVVDEMWFSPNTQIDNRIMSKLESLGKK